MITSEKHEISIRDAVSEYLGFRYSAKQFFNYVNSLPESHIIIDFKDVLFMSRSFAHEYLKRKRDSEKRITEINVPENVVKMFSVVERSRNKSRKVKLEEIRAVAI